MIRAFWKLWTKWHQNTKNNTYLEILTLIYNHQKSTTFSKKVRHLGLKQLVTVPIRTEARYINGTFHITSTLIDRIYCSSERNVASIRIPPLSLSDHFPVFLVRRANAASRQMGNKPSIIQYRSLSNHNEVNFRNDPRSAPWSSIVLSVFILG
jgi:hypothetical protein